MSWRKDGHETKFNRFMLAKKVFYYCAMVVSSALLRSGLTRKFTCNFRFKLYCRLCGTRPELTKSGFLIGFQLRESGPQ